MFGVVLWSDNAENKAVIWCEDHGDLAFYRNEGDDVVLDAGDLVEFEVSTEAQFRYAHKPQRVEGDSRPGLAAALEQEAPVRDQAEAVQNTAQIIPFQAGSLHSGRGPAAASLRSHS